MKFLIYILFRLAIGIFAIIPFKIIYIFSDILSFLFFYIIQYRKKVIIENLKRAFPEKEQKEIKNITRKSYRNLSDIILESLKGFSISGAKLTKRYRILNPELLDEYYKKGQSVIGVTAHYCNWEWGALAGSKQIKPRSIAFYKPLSNKFIDRFLQKSRSESRTELKSIFYTTQTFKNLQDETCLYLMVADQSPAKISKAYWVNFLGRETAWLHGPEKHAKINNYPVIYLDIQRTSRGYYNVTFFTLTENPHQESYGEITEKYVRKLEEIIRHKPENWLWSHKRWKKKRSDNQYKQKMDENSR